MPSKDPEVHRRAKAKYMDAHRERINAERRSAYRLAHPPKPPKLPPTETDIEARRLAKIEYDRAWRTRHRETIRQQMREFKDRNREKVRAEGRAYQSRWRASNPDKVRERCAERRARIAGAPVIEKIDRAAIIKRDKQRCHLCGNHVPAAQIHLDHIVPLSRGGEHSAANLAVAHALCNSRKYNHAKNEQLRLVG